jgi:CDP-diacylglycerol--glycerol-3-phosphate 3-phosphatidyltransferase
MNVPNKISITRICLMPVFILFFLLPYTWSKFLALGIFILAAISDCIDGYIARKYNLVTDLGKFLDPIADKLLATTGLIMLIVGTDPIIPMPYGIIVMFIMILRDYEVTGIRQIGQLKGVIIAADKVAKIKANFLYATLVYGLLISCLKTIEVVNSSAFLTYFTFVFYIFVGITTALIIISGLVYLINNVSVFKENITNQNKKDNDIKLNKNTTKSDNKSSKKITSKTQKANNKQIKDKKTN